MGQYPAKDVKHILAVVIAQAMHKTMVVGGAQVQIHAFLDTSDFHSNVILHLLQTKTKIVMVDLS